MKRPGYTTEYVLCIYILHKQVDSISRTGRHQSTTAAVTGGARNQRWLIIIVHRTNDFFLFCSDDRALRRCLHLLFLPRAAAAAATAARSPVTICTNQPYDTSTKNASCATCLQVMGLLMKAHKTEMDGKLAQKLVSAKLKGA